MLSLRLNITLVPLQPHIGLLPLQLLTGHILPEKYSELVWGVVSATIKGLNIAADPWRHLVLLGLKPSPTSPPCSSYFGLPSSPTPSQTDAEDSSQAPGWGIFQEVEKERERETHVVASSS